MTNPTLRTALARRTLAAAFVVIALALSGVGYWYYRSQAQAIHQSNYEDIAAIAKMKAGQIAQWRNERILDVSREANSPTLIAALGKIAEHGETPEVRERVMKMLAIARNGATYANTIVLSPSGQVLFSTGDGPVSIDAATQRAVEAARANPGGVLSDFFRTPEGDVDIDAVEAVRDAGGSVLGFIILRSRAADYLYPLIQSWPTPSRSAETLLVERDGEDVVFLNDLRHRSKTALSFRLSSKKTELPAVQAVLGRRGMFDGKDYRNIEVVADLGAIPGSPWFLVAKVDREEIMAEARYRAISTGIVVGTFVLLLSLATAFAYTWQHARLFRKLFESERHERETQGLYRATLYSIADGVLTTDTSGRLLEMNAVAERLTGWTEAEARGKPLDKVFVIINHATRATVPNPVTTVLRNGTVVGLANHTVLIARDGTECSIADSAAPIFDESGAVRGVVLVFSDVTERERAAAELLASLHDLKTLKNAVDEHAIVAITNPQGLITFVNDKFCAISKYSREELLGQDHRILNSGFHPKEYFRNLWETIGQGRVWKGKLRNREKDGTFYWLDTTIVPFLDAEGKPYQYVAIRTDITAHKQAQAELMASLEELNRLKAAVDEHAIVDITEAQGQTISLSDKSNVLSKYSRGELLGKSVAITDPHGQITYINDKFCALSKYSREELIGHDHRILKSGFHPKEFFRDLWETISQGRVWKGEVKNRAKDGTFYWLDTTIVPFLDTEGKPYKYVAIRTDITARKQVEEALKESEAFSVSIRDSLTEHLAVLDAQGVIIAVNRAWQRFAEQNGSQELAVNSRGLNYLTVCEKAAGFPNGEEAAAARDGIRAVLAGTKKEFSMDYPCSSPNEQRWFQMHVTPLRDPRKGVVIAHLDITKRKQADDALKQAKQAAEAANQAKDQFIAVLSHELRTPLTPVLATVSALQTQEELPADLKTDMELILRNVEMEAALIDDLLDVTRISRGKIVLQHETVDVHGCLKTALEICRKEIQEKRLEIRSEFQAAQHQVWADPARLMQVFWNLLKNAIKFTPDDGRITLRTQNVGDRVQIEIADTGIGIEPEVMPRIFNLFEQGEQSKIRQFGGLGLGLHIARAVVELHAGRLTAFSEGKDKGATFTVELATIAPQEKPAPSAPSVVPQERPLKILLVEDHLDTLQCLTKLLGKWGHTVTPAENVRTAQVLADTQEIDLLISDLGLPDGSGLDVMRHVKERSGIPGIALSGFGTDEDIRQSRDAGFAEHLVKPVNIVALRTAIQKVAFAGA